MDLRAWRRDDLYLATGLDLNSVVGQKHNGTVDGDVEERIQGLRQSVSAISQRIVALVTWLGAAEVSVLRVLCNLLDLAPEMNKQLAKSHSWAFTYTCNRCSIY